MDLGFGSVGFWLALLQIVWVNILLSGDNAVVIALAARALPPKQQKKAIVIGSGAAIAMRIVLTMVAAVLLRMPWLKMIGGGLLVYIGVSLLLPEGEEGGADGGNGGMFAAVRTILIADLVMSLDNVIAVAAAAMGNNVLLIAGLAISIPLVIFGSTLLLKVIERFPVIVWAGAALLGFIAGEIFVDDPAIHDVSHGFGSALGMSAKAFDMSSGVIGALIVLGLGSLMLRRQKVNAAAAPAAER
ncbi:MAG: TerC family protein [Burkholderiaceae bacterium]